MLGQGKTQWAQILASLGEFVNWRASFLAKTASQMHRIPHQPHFIHSTMVAQDTLVTPREPPHQGFVGGRLQSQHMSPGIASAMQEQLAAASAAQQRPLLSVRHPGDKNKQGKFLTFFPRLQSLICRDELQLLLFPLVTHAEQD